MLKVTHVINDLDVGGAQTMLEGLAGLLSDQVDSSIVVLGGPALLSPRLEAVCRSVQYLGISRKSKNPLKAFLLLRRALKQTEPDIVQSHLQQSDLLAFLCTRLPKVPLIWTFHTTGLSQEDSLQAKLLSRCLRGPSRYVDSLVCCSDSAAREATRRRYIPRNKTVIPNGVRVSAGLPQQQNAQWGGPLKLLHLARWHPMKDHATLFAAVAEAQRSGIQIQLTCAGSEVDSTNDDLAELLEASGAVDVKLIGPVADVQPLFSEADALVISSRYGEALPMAGVEAIAVGLPVIATNVGDAPSLTLAPLSPVRPGSSTELASRFTALADLEPSERLNLRKSSHVKALANFDIARTAEQYHNHYLRLMGGH